MKFSLSSSNVFCLNDFSELSEFITPETDIASAHKSSYCGHVNEPRYFKKKSSITVSSLSNQNQFVTGSKGKFYLKTNEFNWFG